MIGALAGFLTTAASGALAARQAKKKVEESRQQTDQMEQNNRQTYYANLANAGPDSPAAQAQLSLLGKTLRTQQQTNENDLIAGNLTHDQVQTNKQHINDTMANATSQLTANTATLPIALRQSYLGQQNGISTRRRQDKLDEAQNWMNWGRNLASLFANN